jgi:hypothetical protein
MMAESINVRMAKVPDLLTSRELRALFESLREDLVALAASHNQLLADYNAHAHGGVTAGGDTSSDVANSTAAAVTLNTQD